MIEKATGRVGREGQTMWDTLWRGICEAPIERVALRDFSGKGNQILREISYGTLRAFTERFLLTLRREVKRRSRIAVVMEPSAESILLFLALMCSEYAAVLLSPEEEAEAWSKKLKRTKTALLIDTTDGTALSFGDTPVWGEKQVRTFFREERETEPLSAMGEPGESLCRMEDEAFLLFTSGTTGIDKCVIRTQQNATVVLSEMTRSHHYGKDQLLILPAFHLFAIEKLILPAIALGRTLNISRGMRFWTEEIRKYGITELFAVPAQAALLAELMDADGEKELPLRFLISAGAALPGNTAEALDRAGIQAVSEYGSSEGGCIGHPDRAGGRYDMRPGSVGKIRPYLEYRIQGADPGGFGELWLKGSSIAPFYLDERGEPYPTCKDGWFCTGDVGRVDEEGFLYLKGRTKNLIILESGENISPEELEALFLKEEGIRECQVFEYRGELCMLLVPEGGGEDAGKALGFLRQLSQINASLPSWKRIHAFYLSEPFERSSTGKLKRKERIIPEEKNRIHLPEDALLETGASAGITAPEAVLSAFRKAFGKAEIGLEDDFFVLGGDSLCALRISSLLSGLGYQIKFRELFEHTSCRELATFLERNRKSCPEGETDFGEGLRLFSEEPLIAPDIPDKILGKILSDFGGKNVEAVYRAHGTDYDDLTEDKLALQLLDGYFLDRLIVLKEPLEREGFLERVKEITDKHPVLRSRWIKDGDVWYQVVLRSQAPEAFYEDRRSFEGNAAQKLEEIRSEYLKRFVLRRQEDLPKLFQVRCFRLSDVQCVLLVELTHQSTDRYSEELLLRELAEGPDPEEKDNYHRYMFWLSRQRKAEQAEAEGFWKKFENEVMKSGFASWSVREKAEMSQPKSLVINDPLRLKSGRAVSEQIRRSAAKMRITPSELIGFAYGQSYMEHYGLSGMVFTEFMTGREQLPIDPSGIYGYLALKVPCILRITDSPRDYHERLLQAAKYAKNPYRFLWRRYEGIRPLMNKLLYDSSWLFSVQSVVNYTDAQSAYYMGTDIARAFLSETGGEYRIDILHANGEAARKNAEEFSEAFIDRLVRLSDG